MQERVGGSAEAKSCLDKVPVSSQRKMRKAHNVLSNSTIHVIQQEHIHTVTMKLCYWTRLRPNVDHKVFVTHCFSLCSDCVDLSYLQPM